MANDDRWLLAVIVVECAASAMVVIDGGDRGPRRLRRQGARGEGDTGKGGRGREGKGKASKGERARADEGARARAMVYMADDNGKQPEWASDDWVARRLSSIINEIGVTTPQYLPVF
jgi:hypothetical protein